MNFNYLFQSYINVINKYECDEYLNFDNEMIVICFSLVYSTTKHFLTRVRYCNSPAVRK